MSALLRVGDRVEIKVGYRRVNGTVVGVAGGWCRVVVPGSDAKRGSRILPLQWHDRPVESVVVQPRETPDAVLDAAGEEKP